MTWPELAADMMALPGPYRASCGWEMDPPHPTAGLSVCPPGATGPGSKPLPQEPHLAGLGWGWVALSLLS